MIAKPNHQQIILKSSNQILTLCKSISQDNLNFLQSRKTIQTVLQTLEELNIPYKLSTPLTMNL